MCARNNSIELQIAANRKMRDKERKSILIGDRCRSWSPVDYGSDHRNYARWFELPEDFFQNKRDYLEKRGIKVTGLDLMSNTAFLDSLRIEGIAIGLTKIELDLTNSRINNRHTVEGDLLGDRKKIWKEVDTIMKQYGFSEGFYFVTLKGVGGLQSLTKNPIIHFLLFSEMYKRLAEGGTLITEIPTIKDAHLIYENRIIDFWNSLLGIKVEIVKNRTLILEKSQNAPKILPINFTPLKTDIRQWFM